MTYILLDPIFWLFLLVILFVFNQYSYKLFVVNVIIAFYLIIIFIFSLPVFANYIVSLQQVKPGSDHCLYEYGNINLIVLGGGIDFIEDDRLENNKLSYLQIKSYKRLFTAYEFYVEKQPIINKLFISGGIGRDYKEAHVISDILLQMGVSQEHIHVETNSYNTYQNALNLSQLISDEGLSTNVLVTSALHMKRASYAFKSVGIKICEYPTDSIYIDSDVWIPRLSALNKATTVLREVFAYWVYLIKY